MEISTATLHKKILETENIDGYLDDNEKNMLDVTLSEYLNQLLAKKGLILAKVIRKSGLVKSYVHQIFNGEKRPSRDKLIALAFGMDLNVEETQRMLRLGGCSELYARKKRDALILFNIKHGKSISETETDLYERGLDTLLSRDG